MYAVFVFIIIVLDIIINTPSMNSISFKLFNIKWYILFIYNIYYVQSP